MKNQHNEIDKLISAMIKAGENKDRIFLNIKKAGIHISAHELRHRVQVVYSRIIYSGRAAR